MACIAELSTSVSSIASQAVYVDTGAAACSASAGMRSLGSVRGRTARAAGCGAAAMTASESIPRREVLFGVLVLANEVRSMDDEAHS